MVPPYCLVLVRCPLFKVVDGQSMLTMVWVVIKKVESRKHATRFSVSLIWCLFCRWPFYSNMVDLCHNNNYLINFTVWILSTYIFRWLTLLLSQEFSLPEVLRIWDSLFSDSRRFSFLIDICCAMIVYVLFGYYNNI